jgi:hypothetical protein
MNTWTSAPTLFHNSTVVIMIGGYRIRNFESRLILRPRREQDSDADEEGYTLRPDGANCLAATWVGPLWYEA